MKFTPEFFKGNRQRLQQLFTGTAPIVLTANGLMQKASDETYSFCQDSNFWYLTGINQPNIVLVIDKGREYLIIPELSHAREMFDGAIVPEDLATISGIDEILSEKDGWKKLGARLRRSSSVAILAQAPDFIDSLGMYTNPARRRLTGQLQSHNPNLKLLDLRKHLQRMRMVKQPVEIAALNKAISITMGSITTVQRQFKNGKFSNEKQVELELTRQFIKKGAQGHGFDPIIAGGGKAAQIHSMDNTAKVDASMSLLFDVGAQFQQYSADITRCFVQQPSARYKSVYSAVQEVFDYATGILKPGANMTDYEQKIEDFMGEKLRSLGLIKTITSESVRHYFPHRTSHFLGLDVHDYGDYDHPLEPGVVLTVEPGIYIPEESIGVRIEDDILITKSGFKNLSAKLPQAL